METIRYLAPQEKQGTRAMYEEIFPEDSVSFVDYYYEWKTKENKILAMVEDGVTQVMLHLNPYPVWIHGQCREVPYIVAVATRPGCRRKGKMGRVMERALQDLERQQAPFAFLLPADPAYYRGQGFVFFPSQEEIGTGETQESNRVKGALYWDNAGEEDGPELAAFSNNILQRDYHIFIKRDAQYFHRLLAETKAEHGGVLLLKSSAATEPPGFQEKNRCGRDALEGILVYGTSPQENQVEIRELLLAEDITGNPADGANMPKSLWESAFPGMGISFSTFHMMLRIASLKEFVSVLKREVPCCFHVKVTDSIIPGNCGCYRIELGRDGGRIQEIPEEDAELELEIGELAQLLLEGVRVSLSEWV